MSFIDTFASFSAKVINDIFQEDPDKKIIKLCSKIVSKAKRKNIDLSVENKFFDTLKYGFQSAYGESFKTVIVLFIASLLHIFVPTFVVMLSFSMMRAFIGGEHLHSSGKCLIVTTILLIGTGWIASAIIVNNAIVQILIYVVIGFLLELISLTKPFEWMLKKLDGVKL